MSTEDNNIETANEPEKTEEAEETIARGMIILTTLLISAEEKEPEPTEETTTTEHEDQEAITSEVNPSDDSAPQVEASESSTQQPDESNVDNPLPVEPRDDTLIYPEQLFATSNPLFKSVLEAMPPTPRNSSPSQLVIESIHPSKPYDDSLVSPTERKENEVQQPTEVCGFPLIPSDEGAGDEYRSKGIIFQFHAYERLGKRGNRKQSPNRGS